MIVFFLLLLSFAFPSIQQFSSAFFSPFQIVPINFEQSRISTRAPTPTWTTTATSRIHDYGTTSLAAASKKKRNDKKRRQAAAGAQTAKGFGAAPPTLQQILSTFPSRAPSMEESLTECDCGSGKPYSDCCLPHHRDGKICTTMTQVLRSRYTAFKYRNIGYIMSTTHETSRDFREDKVAWAKSFDKDGMFDSFDFVQLEAGPEKFTNDNEHEGYLEFKVTLRAREDWQDSLAGQEMVIKERSKFLRDPENGSWKYASGDVRSYVKGLEDTTLNP
mmetsp:Transcript_14850/g.21253  ORF Transcript_14850/g.21253 Transcript_14850/m.21253 type:complete len:275 (+) Transcript_14850:57-881(+)